MLPTACAILSVTFGPRRLKLLLPSRTINMSPSADITAVSTTDHVENEQLDHSEEDLQDAMYEVDDISDPKPKKKRKIIKPGDKKYNCPHADCGKAYSRAEHLYRHQLNRE